MSANVGTGLEIQPCSLTTNSGHPLNGGDSPSPHSADSNSNVPSSSQSLIGSVLQSARHHLMLEAQITPSISLIPIKQVCISLHSLVCVVRGTDQSKGLSEMNMNIPYRV